MKIANEVSKKYKYTLYYVLLPCMSGFHVLTSIILSVLINCTILVPVHETHNIHTVLNNVIMLFMQASDRE